MEDGRIRAPGHLKPKTRKWWTGIVRQYALESHHIKLLTLAAEAWDRGQAARAFIDENGPTFIDRYGQPKMRPEAIIEKDCRIGFARLVRELALDDDASDPDEFRPPRI